MRRKKKLKTSHYNPYLFHQTTVLPIEIVELEDNSYHLIVKVEIDGIQGDMIIDTGASVTVIDNQLFPEKKEAENGVSMQSGSVSGQIENVRLIQAQQVCIGNKKFKKMQLAEIDLEYVNKMYHNHLKRKIIGLLGCDFLFRYKAVIDYGKKELSLKTPLK